MQKEDHATRLADVQRRIGIYLHALWGCDFAIKSFEGKKSEGNRPYVKKRIIHLPVFCCDFTLGGVTHITGLENYRAAFAHAAAHIMYTKHPFPAEAIDQWQKAMIATVEDARVETLSIRRFPGLKQLWQRQHTATPLQKDSAGDYLNRLARALLDETYRDDDPWICLGRELFSSVDNLESNKISLDIGLALAHAFSDKKIKFNPRSDTLSAPYRDDNRCLWELADTDAIKAQDLPTAFFHSKLLLGNNEFSGKDENRKPGTDKKPLNQGSLPKTYIYPEWDFRSQTETPSWVTLRETAARSGDLRVVDNIVAQNGHLISRMKNLLHAIQYSGVRRIRKLEEGDEIDINAAIRSFIDIRQGVQPDPRIMMRSVRKTRDISVLVLLDLSNSTNQRINGQEQTVLELARQICVLFAEVIETVGDPFAIHGFCSKSRHNVEYFRFKDFGQPYDDVPKAKIAGMTGQRATRMGAAVRHATYYLNQQPSGKKLLMFITDGEPDDVDVQGRQYLRQDAKMAVKDAGRRGIHTYCIGLDPDADQYVSQIFGARNYIVLDHVKCLPEKMLRIYAALSH
ncbi:MAG: nitric oxide reductase activation protein NorD [Gallionella sp.]